jgi:hypothetical protein
MALASIVLGMSGRNQSGRERPIRPKCTETEIGAANLSKRTLEALVKMPSDKRARIDAIIARSQTPEARTKSAADRDILDREYRETGGTATVSAKTTVEDSAALVASPSD